MRKRFLSALFLAGLCALSFAPRGLSAQEVQIETSQGKIIRGMTRDEAISKYGYPVALSDKVWRYSLPEGDVYLYLPPVMETRLYPRSFDVSRENLIELRAFTGSADSPVEDVTEKCDFILSDPSAFQAKQPGVFITKKSGTFQIMARYKKAWSTPCVVTVREQPAAPTPDKDILLSIHVLPHAPVTYKGDKIDFHCFGVFLSREGNYRIYEVKDAEWSLKDPYNATQPSEGTIWFNTIGTYQVSCRSGRLVSLPQDVVVEEPRPELRPEKLRHLLLLPEFLNLQEGKSVRMVVLATYQNNAIREIADQTYFRLNGERFVRYEGGGNFSGLEEGVAEIVAEKDGLRSEPSKVFVLPMGERGKELPFTPAPPRSENDIRRDIKNEINEVVKNLPLKARKLVSLQVIPAQLRLGKGEESRLKAFGTYSDGSTQELTVYAQWVSAAGHICRADKGQVTGVSPGQTAVTAQYNGVESNRCAVTVTGPRLMSIALSPEQARIGLSSGVAFKAEGVFSDDSRKDITAECAWRSSGSPCVSIDKGQVRGVRLGRAQITAEKDGVRSLPSRVTVVITLFWALMQLLKVAGLLALLALVLFFAALAAVNRRRLHILSLKSQPGKFVLEVYRNLRSVLRIAGLDAHPSEPPLTVAAKAETAFSVPEENLRELTRLYEEAMFSRHEIGLEAADRTHELYTAAIPFLTRSLIRSKARIFLSSLAGKTPLRL